MYDPIQFRRRIRRARKAAGLTTSQVAQILYLSQSLVSRYELGQATPPIDRVIELCKLYGCSMDAVCGLREGMEQNSEAGSECHEQEPAAKAGAS